MESLTSDDESPIAKQRGLGLRVAVVRATRPSVHAAPPRTEPEGPAASSSSGNPTPGILAATAGAATPAVRPTRPTGPGVRIHRPPAAPSAEATCPGPASAVPA